jgi:hypothetical protein
MPYVHVRRIGTGTLIAVPARYIAGIRYYLGTYHTGSCAYWVQGQSEVNLLMTLPGTFLMS